MLEKNELENIDMPFIFCPICGLPNGINTFYCPETIEKAHQVATDWAMKEIQRQLGGTIKSINKSGFIKMDLKMPKKETEIELYQGVNDYIIHNTYCCSVSVKVKELEQQIGVYCPVCGGSEI